MNRGLWIAHTLQLQEGPTTVKILNLRNNRLVCRLRVCSPREGSYHSTCTQSDKAGFETVTRPLPVGAVLTIGSSRHAVRDINAPLGPPETDFLSFVLMSTSLRWLSKALSSSWWRSSLMRSSATRSLRLNVWPHTQILLEMADRARELLVLVGGKRYKWLPGGQSCGLDTAATMHDSRGSKL